MLGKKLLTRFTRLGLAMYAVLWCSGLTVSAYDNPIADLAVSGALATVESAYESDTAIPLTDSVKEAAPVPLSEEEDGLSAVSGDGEVSAVMAAETAEAVADEPEIVKAAEDATVEPVADDAGEPEADKGAEPVSAGTVLEEDGSEEPVITGAEETPEEPSIAFNQSEVTLLLKGSEVSYPLVH